MGTVSLANGTYTTSALAPADTAGDDSVTLTNATISGVYAPDGGNDLYSLTGSSVGTNTGFSFQGGAGNDTLTATDSTVSGRISLGAGDDSLYLQNVGNVGVIDAQTGDVGNDTLNLDSVTLVQGTRDILAGAGNDSLSLNAVSGATTVNLGTGSDSLTMTNTTVSSIANSGGTTDQQSISLENSSVNSSLAIQNSSLNHIVLNDSTLNGSMTFNNYTSSVVSPPASSIEIINGSSLAGGISYGTQATLSDYIHIADSTIGGAINNGNQGANSLGADTMLIENATFNSTDNVINLSGNGDRATVTGTNMDGANVNINGGTGQNFTISIDNSTLDAVVNQSSGNLSLDIQNTSMENLSFQQTQAADSLTINISNSTLTARTNLGAASETLSLLNGSEFGGDRIYMFGGNDSMVLGTDTRFTGNTNNIGADLGLNGAAGNDTLQLYGQGAFSLSLLPGEAATLQDNTTVTLVTNENIDQVVAWAMPNNVNVNIRGTLSLAESNSTVLIQQFEDFSAVPCFLNGTLIMTDKGERPVESLRVGDLVQTADAGLQPIRWVNSSYVSALNMLLKPEMVPIRIKQGALGNGLPVRDLLVSPQHRMLVSNKIVERMFGTDQVLVAAKHLLDIEGIERATEQTGFEYIHFMLDDHHVAYAEGAPTESLFIGEMSAEIFGESAQKELELIFPELTMPVSDRIMKPARLFVSGKQVRNLAQRASKNGHCLVSKKDSMPALLSA